MSLQKARFHSENRRLICFWCANKDKKYLFLQKYISLVQLIKDFFDPGFRLNINSHPTEICGSCKTNLYLKQKGKASSKAVETSWINGHHQLKKLGRST